MKLKNSLIFIISFFLFAPIYGEAKNPLKIVVTTSHLEVILNAVGKENFKTDCLIPGGSCPGHFDISPDAARKIVDADIFITHSWEQRFDDIVKNIGEKNVLKVSARTPGNWMVPGNNIRAVEEITSVIEAADPGLSRYFMENKRKYINEIEKTAAKEKKKFNKYNGFAIICAEHQKEFMEWLGFRVLADYGRPEDLSLKKVKEIMQTGKKENPVLVVDNLQSGPEAGLEMAKDLKIPHVTLHNFPVEGSYTRTLEKNCDIIQKALR